MDNKSAGCGGVIFLICLIRFGIFGDVLEYQHLSYEMRLAIELLYNFFLPFLCLPFIVYVILFGQFSHSTSFNLSLIICYIVLPISLGILDVQKANSNEISYAELLRKKDFVTSHFEFNYSDIEIHVNDAEIHKRDYDLLKEIFQKEEDFEAVVNWGEQLKFRLKRIVANKLERNRKKISANEKTIKQESKHPITNYYIKSEIADKKNIENQGLADQNKKLNAVLSNIAQKKFNGHIAYRTLAAPLNYDSTKLSNLHASVDSILEEKDSFCIQILNRWVKHRHSNRNFFDKFLGKNIETSIKIPDTKWFSSWLLYAELAIEDEVFAIKREKVFNLFEGKNHLYDRILQEGEAVLQKEFHYYKDTISNLRDICFFEQLAFINSLDKLNHMELFHDKKVVAFLKEHNPNTHFSRLIRRIGIQPFYLNEEPMMYQLISDRNANFKFNLLKIADSRTLENLLKEETDLNDLQHILTKKQYALYYFLLFLVLFYLVRYAGINLAGRILNVREEAYFLNLKKSNRWYFIPGTISFIFTLCALTWLNIHQSSLFTLLRKGEEIWIIYLGAALFTGMTFELIENLVTILFHKFDQSFSEASFKDEFVLLLIIVPILCFYGNTCENILVTTLFLVRPYFFFKLAHYLPVLKNIRT